MGERRAKGTGSITKRSNNSYMVRYKGRTAYASSPTEASDKLNTLIATYVPNEDTLKIVNVKDAMKRWMTMKSLSLKPTSYDRLEQTVNTHIIPQIGSMSCDTISEDIIVEKIIQPMQRKGLSFSSIKKAQDCMCAFSRWAASPSRKYMAFDPMASFEKVKRTAIESSRQGEDSNTSIVYMDATQRVRFANACRARYESSGRWRFKYGLASILAMYTGLRLGELLALKWDRVDFEKKTILVDCGVVFVKDRDPKSKSFGKKVLVFTPYTKTDRPRIVPLGTKAHSTILEIYNERNKKSPYVVCNHKGELVLPSVFESMLERIYDLADISIPSGTNAHALRHTFASMCFDAGMNIRTISELLGHSSVQITMDTYIHLVKEKNLENIPQLADLE